MTLTPVEKPSSRDPKSINPVGAIERGLSRLRKISLNVQTKPLRELRLEMWLDIQVVYFTVRAPFADDVTLRIPVATAITPKFYSPTRAQHL